MRDRAHPPRLAERLLERATGGDLYGELVQELREEYAERIRCRVSGRPALPDPGGVALPLRGRRFRGDGKVPLHENVEAVTALIPDTNRLKRRATRGVRARFRPRPPR